MNVLDENIPANQREMLIRRRVRARQIGFDIGHSGMQDEEILPFLLRLRRPTFFTRDGDFYDRRLCHAKYSLVHLDVRREEVALFVRRLLAHSELDTQANRMGSVIRVSHTGLSVWRLHTERELRLSWK